MDPQVFSLNQFIISPYVFLYPCSLDTFGLHFKKKKMLQESWIKSEGKQVDHFPYFYLFNESRD